MAQVGLASQADVDRCHGDQARASTCRSAGQRLQRLAASRTSATTCSRRSSTTRRSARPAPSAPRLLLRGGLTITTTLDPKVAGGGPEGASTNHVPPARQGRVRRWCAVAAGHRQDHGDGRQPRLRRRQGRDQVQPGHRPGVRRQHRLPGRLDVQGLRRGRRAGEGHPVQLPDHVAPYQKRTSATSPTLRRPRHRPVGPAQRRARSETGTYTLQTGIADSVNTYFAQLEEKVGVCRPCADRRRRSASGPRRRQAPLAQVTSFTLGTNDVSPLSMAEAYATFAAARRALQRRSRSSASTDPTGKHAARCPRPTASRRSSQKVADGVNELLQGVMTSRHRRSARPLSRPAAGKTGTTDSRVSRLVRRLHPGARHRRLGRQPAPAAQRLPAAQPGRSAAVYYGDVFGGCLPGPIWQQIDEPRPRAAHRSARSPARRATSAVARPTRCRRSTGMSVDERQGDAAGRAASSPSVGNDPVLRRPTPQAGTVAYTSPGRGARAPTPGSPSRSTSAPAPGSGRSHGCRAGEAAATAVRGSGGGGGRRLRQLQPTRPPLAAPATRPPAGGTPVSRRAAVPQPASWRRTSAATRPPSARPAICGVTTFMT